MRGRFRLQAEAEAVREFEVALHDEPERPPAAAPCPKQCGRVLRGHAHGHSHDNYPRAYVGQVRRSAPSFFVCSRAGSLENAFGIG